MGGRSTRGNDRVNRVLLRIAGAPRSQHAMNMRTPLSAFLFLWAIAFPAESGAARATQPRRISAQGVVALRTIIATGRLEILQWPEFQNHQAEIGAFYRSLNYTLVWSREARPTATARAVIQLLQAADNEGLLAQDYDRPLWEGRLASLESRDPPPLESELLRFDLALTICAMRYILDLHLGRINPQSHASFDVAPDIHGPSEFLRKRVVPAHDVAAALRALEPPFPAYRRLVRAVQQYKEMALLDDGEPLPAAGTPVKPGAPYAGTERLTRLLSLLGDLPPQAVSDPGRYSEPLVTAVKRFQNRHGLTPDGVLGKETLRQLNTPLEHRLRQLRLTLERWRWLPRRFSRPPIIINIPEFRLYAGEEPAQKVVVGKALERKTPVFASQLTEVVFRPPWNVPLSIQREVLAGKIEKNPGYLDKHDFEVIDRRGASFGSGPPDPAILKRLRDGMLFLRQRPGPRNSLGLVKFMMPNNHSIYIHGTPSRRGFLESRRDLSYGCIRVQDTEALAVWALQDRPEWTPERIRAAMEGARTVTVKLTAPIPVFIQYGTAAVSDDGEVRFYDDIYGRDAAEAAKFEARARLAR